MHFVYTSGVIPPLIFVLLLEGKADLSGCGKVFMPSSEMMAQAPPAVIKRLESIEEVDLKGMQNLSGGPCRMLLAYRYVPCS